MATYLQQKDYEKYLKTKSISLIHFDRKSSVHRCNKCSKEWKARPSNVMRNQSGCKQCMLRKRRKDASVHSFKTYKQTCKEKRLKIIGTYVNKLTKIDHRCLNCKHIFSVKPNDIDNAPKGRNRCPKCYSDSPPNNQLSIKEIKKRVKEKGKLKLIRLSDTIKGVRRAKFQCLKCTTVFSARLHDVIHRGSGCPACKLQSILLNKNLYKKKIFALGKREVVVLGYEHYALSYLLSKGVRKTSIQAGLHNIKIPVIKYKHRAKLRRYYPDIYVKCTNTLIEVKSTYTLGLKDRYVYERLRNKAKAVLEQGYRFKLLVFTQKGEKMKTPKDWHLLSYKKFVTAFTKLNR